MANQQVVAQPKAPKQHWVRRFSHVVIMALSLLFSVISACELGAYFSTLKLLGDQEWVMTDLVAVSFSAFGFFVSRAFADCVQRKESNKYVVFAICFFEFVEIGVCFTEGVHSAGGIVWSFSNFPDIALRILQYLILSSFPAFTILCGQLEIVFHRVREGMAPAQSPAVQPPTNAGAPLPVVTQQKKPLSPPAAQTKFAPPSAGSYGVPLVQNASSYQKPVSPPPPVCQNGSPSPVEAQTRELPETELAAYRRSSLVPPTTDYLADDATLITESQVPVQEERGGFWSKLPFSLGGKQNEQSAQFPEIMV